MLKALTPEKGQYGTPTLPDGTRKAIARSNGVPKVDVTDPKAPHKRMVLELDDPQNRRMHDMTAYLWTIK